MLLQYGAAYWVVIYGTKGAIPTNWILILRLNIDMCIPIRLSLTLIELDVVRFPG